MDIYSSLGKKLFNPFLADPFLFEQELKDLMLKELFAKFPAGFPRDILAHCVTFFHLQNDTGR